MPRVETTFLIVDDNELDVEKIKRGFKRLDLPNNIEAARDGYEALDRLRGSNGAKKLEWPYIIMLDLNMPRMNGLEFLEALRGDSSIAHAPVFVLTTSDRQEDVSAAYRFNVCGYIVKPIAMASMFEALATLKSFWRLSEYPLAEPSL